MKQDTNKGDIKLCAIFFKPHFLKYVEVHISEPGLFMYLKISRERGNTHILKGYSAGTVAIIPAD